jgi:hypothetical protein
VSGITSGTCVRRFGISRRAKPCGFIYANGRSVPRDNETALSWYHEAASSAYRLRPTPSYVFIQCASASAGDKRGDSLLPLSKVEFQHQLALSWINCQSTYDSEVAVTDSTVGRTEDGMIECIFRFQAQLEPNSFMRTRQ